MLAVTYVGHKLSGNIRDRKGFFQADGSMPWWAVSASIIATVVSSVTFISVPAAVFADGGNLTYFQVILGLAAGKIVVARLLARPFYESQGVATSYEYIAHRIDPATGEFSMYLGLLLNVINSGVKLLTAGLVLDVISGWGLAPCALFVMVVSVLWGSLAGIKTVIWTDFLLFGLFALGAGFALIYVLCYFNLMFFVTQIIQIIFLKKLDRTYTFPTIGFFSDLTLFVVSAYTLWYIQTEIMLDINVEGVPA